MSYSDLKIENLDAVRHLGFDRKWIFTIQRPRGSHTVSAIWIWTQSSKAWL